MEAHRHPEPLIEPEPPSWQPRVVWSGARMLAGSATFFFISFVFAYFYLRSLNNADMWKPGNVDASVGWGTAVVACYVVSAVLVRLGLADHRALRRPRWRQKGGAALLVGVAGLVLQVIAWTHEGFGPTDGGFASVYFGWTAFLFLFVFGTLLWLEMTLATSLRYRKLETGAPAPGEASGDPHRMASDIRDPLSLVRAELVALSFYWTFLAGIAVVSWVVLYLI
jgi:heme/copper-type cytochrome/quinol oxidase subunit 3